MCTVDDVIGTCALKKWTAGAVSSVAMPRPAAPTCMRMSDVIATPGNQCTGAANPQVTLVQDVSCVLGLPMPIQGIGLQYFIMNTEKPSAALEGVLCLSTTLFIPFSVR